MKELFKKLEAIYGTKVAEDLCNYFDSSILKGFVEFAEEEN